MAVDTAAKRRSAVAARRLPWFRRFIPAPDGSVTAADRRQVALVYVGGAAVPPGDDAEVLTGRAAYRRSLAGAAVGRRALEGRAEYRRSLEGRADAV